MTTVGSVLQSIVSGKSIQTMERPAQEGEFGILKVSAVTWGEFRPHQNKAMPADYDPGECPRPMDGDILISRANTRELVGAPVLVRGDHPQLLLSDKLLKLVLNSALVDRKYLVRALRFPAAKAHFFKCAGGSSGSMTNITQGDIRSAPIPLPPLEEQRRIAAILDQAETLRTQRRAALAQLDSLTQSIFTDMFGDTSLNSKGFSKVPLGSLMKLKSGDFLPASKMAPDGRHPVYGGNGVNGFHDSFMFKESKIVIGRVGAYCGCVHVTKPQSWITDNALYLDNVSESCDAEYLAFALTEARLNQFSSQSGQPLISGSRLAPVPLLVPPLPLQQIFATRIQAIESLKATHRAALVELDALFASLQQRAFSGELTVSSSPVQLMHTRARDFSELCRLDAEKGLEALIHVSNGMPEHHFYKALKTLYFADKHHLEHHGRLIYGETHCALPMGPVPQAAYDAAKVLSGELLVSTFPEEALRASLRRTDKALIPLRAANLQKLSAEERESLDWAIRYVAPQTFEQVKTASHDAAYERTPRNMPIELAHIVAMFPEAVQKRFAADPGSRRLQLI